MNNRIISSVYIPDMQAQGNKYRISAEFVHAKILMVSGDRINIIITPERVNDFAHLGIPVIFANGMNIEIMRKRITNAHEEARFEEFFKKQLITIEK